MLTELPNLLTIGRVLLVPLVVGCFYVEADWGRWLALALFALAAASDYLDGQIARSRGLQSAFGRWLDPVADKVLVGAVLLMLVGEGTAPVLPSVVIVLRELLVSGLREYMAEARLGLPVTGLAKWKTSVQMLAIALLLVGGAGPEWLALAGAAALWVAALLTAVTGWAYLRVGVGHMMAEDRAAAPGRRPSPRLPSR